MAERRRGQPGDLSGLVLEFSDATFGQEIHGCWQRDNDQCERRVDEGRRGGRDRASLFLDTHFDKLGRESSADIAGKFL